MANKVSSFVKPGHGFKQVIYKFAIRYSQEFFALQMNIPDPTGYGKRLRYLIFITFTHTKACVNCELWDNCLEMFHMVFPPNFFLRCRADRHKPRRKRQDRFSA